MRPISDQKWKRTVSSKTLLSQLFVKSRLQQLLIDEMRKKKNRLLGLTKDETHLREYLSQKEAILRDYYVVQDLGKFA